MVINPGKPSNRSQRLFIELGASLLLEPKNNPDNAVSGELIGMQVADYLIVRLPKDAAGQPRALQETLLQVKYFCSSEVFGFVSRVIQSLSEPERIIFLEYPETVESYNARSDVRFDCFIPVRIALGDHLFDGVVININVNGCMCVIEQYPESMSITQNCLTIYFPLTSDSTINIQGEIRNIRKSDGRVNFGVSFSNINGFEKSALRALIPALNY